jgi:Tfp pilus assembly protein FimV
MFWLMGLTCCAGMLISSPKVFAAEPAAAQQASPSSNRCGDAQTYQVKKGETLKTVLNRFYPNSPLKEDWLMVALMKANPQRVQGKKMVVRSGDCIHLPDHSSILLDSLTTYLTPEDISAWASSVANPSNFIPGPDWVRYP